MNNNNLPIGMTNIVDDLDRYSDTFMNAFWPNSTDVTVIQDWLRHDLDSLVIDEIVQNFPFRQDVNVMGVGSGDGSMDQIIIDNFRRRFGKVRYTVIEPGKVIERFKNDVFTNDEMKDIVFDWRNATLSEVCRNPSNYENRFAFISAIHSAYYFDNLSDSLMHLFSFLKEGGALMLIANSDDNILVRFLESLSWREKNTQSRFTTKIAEYAKANAQPIETFDLPAKINVTSCFDETSTEGGKLLDFLTEVAYFRETAPSDIKKDTMSVMKSLATEGVDGKLYFKTNCKAMVMMKGSKVGNS